MTRSLPATPELRPALPLALILAAAPAAAVLAGPTGQSGTAEGVSRILIPIGGLIVIAVIGGVGVLAVRRWMLANNSTALDHGGLLDDLKRMRDLGQLSQEEFDAARKSIAARLAGRAQPGRASPPNLGARRPSPPGSA